jgi:hypothetical protein
MRQTTSPTPVRAGMGSLTNSALAEVPNIVDPIRRALERARSIPTNEADPIGHSLPVTSSTITTSATRPKPPLGK